MRLSRRTKQNLVKDLCQVLKQSKCWIKNTEAVDKEDHWIEPQSKDAIKFCITGAIDHVCSMKNRNFYVCRVWLDEQIATIVDTVSSSPNSDLAPVRNLIVGFNDCYTTTFKDVRRVLNKLRRKVGLVSSKKKVLAATRR